MSAIMRATGFVSVGVSRMARTATRGFSLILGDTRQREEQPCAGLVLFWLVLQSIRLRQPSRRLLPAMPGVLLIPGRAAASARIAVMRRLRSAGLRCSGLAAGAGRIRFLERRLGRVAPGHRARRARSGADIRCQARAIEHTRQLSPMRTVSPTVIQFATSPPRLRP